MRLDQAAVVAIRERLRGAVGSVVMRWFSCQCCARLASPVCGVTGIAPRGCSVYMCDVLLCWLRTNKARLSLMFDAVVGLPGPARPTHPWKLRGYVGIRVYGGGPLPACQPVHVRMCPVRSPDSKKLRGPFCCEMHVIDELLLSETSFNSAELAGLDQPVEIFAVDTDRTWGLYWQNQGLEAAPPLPSDSAGEPEEGGYFLLRPLGRTALSWQPLANRRLRVPTKETHAALGLPAVSVVSNRVFVELRYSLPPSLVSTFDFDELRDGVFRAFALPVPDDPCLFRLCLVVDELAAADTLRRGGTAHAGAAPWRLERFLMGAAVSPPTARWASTLDDMEGEGEAANDGGGDGGDGGEGGLFRHQHRSVAWWEEIEAATGDERVVHVSPISIAGRKFGNVYSVQLPRGGCIAHPPGAGKSRVVATIVARSSRATLLLCPGHLLPLWRAELEETLGAPATTVTANLANLANSDGALASPGNGAGGSDAPVGWVWGDKLFVVGFHALECLELGHLPPVESGPPNAPSTEHPLGVASAAACEAANGARLLEHSLLAGHRLIVDEPQDAPETALETLLRISERSELRWVLCGTAAAHLPLIGALLCGTARWRAVNTLVRTAPSSTYLPLPVSPRTPRLPSDPCPTAPPAAFGGRWQALAPPC